METTSRSDRVLGFARDVLDADGGRIGNRGDHPPANGSTDQESGDTEGTTT